MHTESAMPTADMTAVREIADSIPIDDGTWEVERQEELFLKLPPEMPGMRLWSDHEPLSVIEFPNVYIPSKFAPPTGVFESDHLRLEWQKMKGRQPFYHRNADVDEISYQVYGKRTLMTELGSVELVPGDFSRIPVGVAHDNYGVEEIHLLFYIPCPTKEVCPTQRTAKPLIPPFEGWKSAVVPEMTSQHLGARGSDVAMSMTDETTLLKKAETSKDAIQVLRGQKAGPDPEWMYHSEHVWIGRVCQRNVKGHTYRRHRRAYEIQYQVSGERTLVTLRGTVVLKPGEFINIPLGCAFTDIVGAEESVHINVVTFYPAEPKQKFSKHAEPSSVELIAKARSWK